MINSVYTTNAVKSGTFSDFKQPKNGYYINAPFNEKTQEEVKNKKSHKLGKTITLSALAVGFGTLAIFSGRLNKGATKYLNKWRVVLEQKIAKGGKYQNFYRYALAKTESFLGKTESINNFTTFKDVICQRLMWGKDGQRTFTRRIHEGITKVFNKISRSTVNSSYATTQEKFSRLTEHFASINEEILRAKPADTTVVNTVNSLNSKIASVNRNLENGFGINARAERLKEVHKATDGLFDYFWNASLSDIKNFRSKDMWQSYIAETYMQPAKNKLAADTSALRRAISHNILDSYKASSGFVDELQKLVNPSDLATNEVLNSIRSGLTKYKKLSGAQEATERTGLCKEISQNLKKLVGSFKSVAAEQKYGDNALKSVAEYASKIEKAISNNSKGELEEILTTYKALLPRDKYLKLKAEVAKAVKSLDKSIDIETVQYVDKARDLKLGAAPTDVLSILTTVGAVGYYVSKSDNKDERISASLKYGIPAIGAIATSLFCTAKLISGGKAMFFGLVSGWAINKIGVFVDDLRKKYSLNVSFRPRDLLKPQSDNV